MAFNDFVIVMPYGDKIGMEKEGYHSSHVWLNHAHKKNPREYVKI